MNKRALLDTNILIHREARTVIRDDIGTLFRWLDELKYEKLVHPDSVREVKKHADPDGRADARPEAPELSGAEDEGARHRGDIGASEG